MNSQEIIKFRTEVLGITQVQFAKLLDVSTKSISRWECGTSNPTKSVLSKLDGLMSILENNKEKDKIISIIKLATSASTGSVLALILAGITVPTTGVIGGLTGLTELISGLIQNKEN